MRAKCLVAAALGLLLVASGCGSEQAQTQDEVATEVVTTTSVATQSGQTLGLESVENARELGGYPTEDGRRVRHGVLLRSASLSTISERDVTRLRERYSLSVIADLRTSSEVDEDPDPSIPGVTNLDLYVIDESEFERRNEIVQDMLDEQDDPTDEVARAKCFVECGFATDRAYVEILMSSTGKAGYRRLFDQLMALPEGRALLIHGVKGKDRTGIAAMLVLSALGASEQTIREDYLLTNDFLSSAIVDERLRLMDAGVVGDDLQACLSVLDEADVGHLDTALEWLDNTYGSARDYVTRELGVTQESLSALRDKFLE